MQKTIDDIKTVVTEKISTDKFSKQSNRKILLDNQEVKLDSYTLMLSEKETYEIIADILERVKNNNYIVEGSDLNLFGNEITNELLQQGIEKYINEINSKELSQEQMIMATVYISEKQMVKLDLSITAKECIYQASLEILENSNTLKLTVSKQKGQTIQTVDILTRKDENGSYTIELKYNNESNDATENNQSSQGASIIIKTKTEGSISEGKATSTIGMELTGDNSKKAQIKLVNETNVLEDIQIENISESNCSFINDMKEEKVQYLYSAIKERLMNLYNEKKKIIESGELQEQIKPVDDNVKKHNAKFEMYEGEFAGKIVVDLLNKIIDTDTSADAEYLIALKTKLTEDDETELKGEEVVVEKVQPLANLLDSEAMYKIIIHYQPVSGAIDEIQIEKVGLPTVETPQVVIQNQTVE